MRSQRNTLLAGIAALALIAGTGFASAQDAGKDQNGAKGQEHNAATQQMNKPSNSGKMGQNAQKQGMTSGNMGQNANTANNAQGSKGSQRSVNKSAQRGEENQGQYRTGQMTSHTAQGMQHKHGMTSGQTATERRNMPGQKSTFAQREHKGTAGMQRNAQRQRKGFEGLQGNAATNVQINEQQRSRIRTTVIEARGAPRVDHVNFAVRVGTVVPRSGVRIVPVPETLVRINPSWRGMLYFVYENELVLVNPHTMRIVAVVYA